MMKYFIIKLKKRNKIVGLTHDKSNFILYNLDNLKNLNKIDENMILNSETRATLRLDSYHSKILKENEIVSDIYRKGEKASPSVFRRKIGRGRQA